MYQLFGISISASVLLISYGISQWGKVHASFFLTPLLIITASSAVYSWQHLAIIRINWYIRNHTERIIKSMKWEHFTYETRQPYKIKFGGVTSTFAPAYCFIEVISVVLYFYSSSEMPLLLNILMLILVALAITYTATAPFLPYLRERKMTDNFTKNYSKITKNKES